MLKRFLALFVLLVFAGQTLAAGFECEKGGMGDSAAEMSCCRKAKSASSSPVAMLCCQTVCGEPTSGTPGPQSDQGHQGMQVPAPVFTAEILASINSLLAELFPVSKGSTEPLIVERRSADALILQLHPPAVYLNNSTFLI